MITDQNHPASAASGMMPFNRSPRHGASLIELLVVVAILVVILMVVLQGVGGSKGHQGAQQNAMRQIEQLNMNALYQGFFMYATNHRDVYPSTKTASDMQTDTTHEVFAALLRDQDLDARQLVSKNESDADINVYDGNGPFTVNNTSFDLEDYDADNWLRYRNWGINGATSNFVLMSDRWYDDKLVPNVHNINYRNASEIGFWNVLMNDGSTSTSYDANVPGIGQATLPVGQEGNTTAISALKKYTQQFGGQTDGSGSENDNGSGANGSNPGQSSSTQTNSSGSTYSTLPSGPKGPDNLFKVDNAWKDTDAYMVHD